MLFTNTLQQAAQMTSHTAPSSMSSAADVSSDQLHDNCQNLGCHGNVRRWPPSVTPLDLSVTSRHNVMAPPRDDVTASYNRLYEYKHAAVHAR